MHAGFVPLHRLNPSLARRLFAVFAIVSVACFALAGAALAQAPANDNVANAQMLTGQAGRIVGSNANATLEGGEPVHPLNVGGKSIWYQWTAAVAGSARFDTVGTGFDTIMAVYTNSPGGLRLIGGVDNPNSGFINDSGGYLESRINLATVTVGRTYYFSVDGYNAGAGAASGPIVLNWNQVVNAPANDSFGSAVVLSGSQGGVSGRNHMATLDNNEPAHAGQTGGRSVWFRWVAPATGDAVFDTFGSTFDTVLAAYSGNSISGLDGVAANDDAVVLDLDGDGTNETPYIVASRITFRATSGTSYRIAVDGHNAGFGAAQGSISLHYYFASTAPTNDALAGAATLTGTKGQITGSTLASTREVGEPFHSISTGGRSVWFKWTAPASGQATFDTLGLHFDSVLAVYTGGVVSALGPVAANDDLVPGIIQLSRASFAAEAGVTYRIAVDGFSNSVAGSTADFNPITLNWELAATAPTNDLFAHARELPGRTGSLVVSNTTAVFESLEPLHGPIGGKSLWFKWTAAGGRGATFDTAGSSFDTLLSIYTGNDLTNLTFVAGNDDDETNLTNLTSRVTFPATNGFTYWIAVDGYNPGNGRGAANGTVMLSWSQPGGPPPNDHFTNAIVLTGLSGTTNGFSWDATIEPEEPDRGSIGPAASSWYRWTPPVSGWFTFDTRGGALDTVLGIYTGSSFPFFLEAGSNDNLSEAPLVPQSRVTFRATAGVPCHIAVDGASGAQGEFVLNWVPSINLAVAVNGGHLVVTITAAEPGFHQLESSANLSDWTVVDSVEVTGGPVMLDLGPIPATSHRFFRASR